MIRWGYNKTRAPLRRRRQRGISLIEILVTTLVVAVGLLGFAGLQTVSTQYNHSSYMRTHANNMAHDIADRMRANRESALNGNYDIGFDDDPPDGESIASQDLREWRNAIDGTLPSGTSDVEVTGDNLANIKIRWLDDRGDGDGDEELRDFEMETRI